MYRASTPPLIAPRLDAAVLDSLARHLEDFAAALDPRDREALSAVLATAAPGAGVAALAAESAEDVLSAEEIAFVNRLPAEPATQERGRRDSLVLVMKATRRCNLRCTYCHSWADGPNQNMTFEVLARAIHGALTAPGVRLVEFVWHGGETTLLPRSFFQKALWLEERFRRPGQKVKNAMQTNGVNLSAEWLEFCRRYSISLGISLDGPPEIHDRRRIDIAGRPTAARVHQALKDVQASGLEHGVLMVIDSEIAAAGAERLLAHLLEIGVRNVGLLNVIPENRPTGSAGLVGLADRGSFIPWPSFVGFLRELFRLWWPEHKERINFRELADLVGKIQGRGALSCVFDGNCMGGFLTVEPQGEISACDKFLRAEGYQFGDVRERELAELLVSPALDRAHSEIARGIDQSRSCPWFQVCQGGCPHDRFLRGRLGIGSDESCCGLAELLDDMARTLDVPQVSTRNGNPLGARLHSSEIVEED